MFDDENMRNGEFNQNPINSADEPAAFQTSPTETPAAPAYEAPVYTAPAVEEPAAPVYEAPIDAAPAVNYAPVNTQPTYTAPAQPAYGAPENPYSPYAARNYDTNPYMQQSNQTPAPAFKPAAQEQEPDKKKKKEKMPKEKKSHNGAAVFAIIISIFALAAVVLDFLGVTDKIKEKINAKSDNDVTTTAAAVKGQGTGDKVEVSLTAKPSGEISSTAEIAEKCRMSNIGILIYSGDGESSSTIGEGSGVAWCLDSTGEYTYFITCAHVIDTKGATIKVQTEEGDIYNAEVIGYDTRTDLGVIRVHETCFTLAEFGDSDALSVGEPVYAIGNPGGVEFFGSFTAGYVSAINRPISSEIGYTMKCIQHDASINPGNSGGMLVNAYGQVVGINSQKIADTSFEGMGFAVPITAAKPILESLVKYGYVPNRPMLGISYYSVNSIAQYYAIAQKNNLPASTLVISEINSASSLANTDVRRGDMIIAVNGKDLTTPDILLELIDNGKVGDKLTLTIARVTNNYKVETFEVEVTLVEDKGNTVITSTDEDFPGFGD